VPCTSCCPGANLPISQFPTAVFGVLYHERWRLEEAFKRLKHGGKLESVSGPTQLLHRVCSACCHVWCWDWAVRRVSWKKPLLCWVAIPIVRSLIANSHDQKIRLNLIQTWRTRGDMAKLRRIAACPHTNSQAPRPSTSREIHRLIKLDLLVYGS